MLHSSLDSPSDPYGLPEVGYSLDVEQRLIQAYALLATGVRQSAAYLLAYESALPCLDREISARQRLRVLYVLGSALIAGEAVERGIAYIEQAMVDAELIHDWLAWIELAYLAGSAKSSILKYSEAISYFTAGLAASHAAFADDGPVNADFEFRLLLSSAYAKYLMSEYHSAARLLSAARSAYGDTISHDLSFGTLYWMEGLVLRWNAQPDKALEHVLQANDAYQQATTPSEQLSHGRLQTVITEIALDLVERLPEGTERSSLLSFAAPLPTHARTIANRFGDAIGMHLAALAQARLGRLACRNIATHEAIWKVLGAAENIGDAALVAQARTAMGQELVARGWRDAGPNYYRQTLRDLRTTQVPALGKWARDKLVEASQGNW